MKNKKKRTLIIISFVILCIFCVLVSFYKIENEKKEQILLKRKKLETEIASYYNTYVKTNKETYLYNEKEEQVGKLGANVELFLDEQEIDYKTKYFVTNILDEIYYIKYQDTKKIEELSKYEDRYKKYIVFNENIVTKEKTSFYDEFDNLVYQFNKSFNLPIIIKDTNKYGVEFNNRLLYVKEEDIKEVIESHNTDLSNTKGVPVLNYHFVYENGNTKCREEICHSEEQMNKHFTYIKDNNFFTPTLEELEMYIDAKIRLPKSVVITFDDGALAENARNFVDKYELDATLFLITSWFSKEQFESKYLKIASHGHDLHNPGVCSGGQGGAIKCLEKGKLLNDLRTSREILNNTTYFCYPFYEYNNYSIEVLKEAGYTMAFAGESSRSDNLVKVGSDKFRLPRFVVVNYTTMKNFTNYINVD